MGLPEVRAQRALRESWEDPEALVPQVSLELPAQRVLQDQEEEPDLQEVLELQVPMVRQDLPEVREQQAQ
jgi:hypothetical protein